MKWLCRLVDKLRHRARLRHMAWEQALGKRGEDLAHRYLEAHGMQIVARNYRPPSARAEIDLIARDRQGTLVIVEVKCRTSDQVALPERNVDSAKYRQMLRAAGHYARRAGVPVDRLRFDVVSVVLSDPPVIRHLRDVYPLKTL